MFSPQKIAKNVQPKGKQRGIPKISWAIGPSVLVLHPELVHQGEDKITKNGHEQLLFIRVD